MAKVPAPRRQARPRALLLLLLQAQWRAARATPRRLLPRPGTRRSPLLLRRGRWAALVAQAPEQARLPSRMRTRAAAVLAVTLRATQAGRGEDVACMV